MLYLDTPLTINGITLYRDLLDEKLYYYLPTDVKIARDEKGLSYAVYVDSSVHGKDELKDDVKELGGLLSLDVEMGPTDAELSAVASELAKSVGQGVKLTPVPFESGTVKLLMFGQDSKNPRENEPLQIWFAGTSKPSLMGKHTATFNNALAGVPAQIMLDLLKNTPQTQLSVAYEMDFMGVIPAYNLEITVDFKATETYWNNHVDLGVDVDAGEVKVLANADIDSVIRDLLNDGSIIITETDYTKEHRYDGNVSAQIELVKKLLSTELFNPTAVPAGDNSILKNALENVTGEKGVVPDKKEDKKEDKKDTKDAKPEKTANAKAGGAEERKTDTSTKTQDAPAETPAEPAKSPGASGQETGSVAPSDADIDEEVLQELIELGEKAAANDETEDLTEEERAHLTKSNKPKLTDTSTPPENEEPEESETDKISVNVNVGYTLRHRKISEQVKRTFKFNRREVKTCNYNNSASLSTTENVFDPDKQVHEVELKQGIFHRSKLTFVSGVRFKDFGITKAVINWHLEDKKETETVVLDEKTESEVKEMNHDDASAPGIFYTVKFASEYSGPIKTPEIKTSERAILVGLDQLEGKKFVNIETGTLDEAASVLVSILPEGKDGDSTESRQISKDNPKFPVFIDACDTYDIRLEYPNDKSSQPQVVTYHKLTGSLFVVNNPRKVQVSPLLGANTFKGSISAILVDLTYKDGQTTQFLLDEDTPKDVAYFDYEIGGDAPKGNIQVSYQIIRSDSEVLEDPIVEEFPEDTENIRLKIMKIS